MNTQTIAEKLKALKDDLVDAGATVYIEIEIVRPDAEIKFLESESVAIRERFDELAELLEKLGLSELVHGNISSARFNELREKLK